MNMTEKTSQAMEWKRHIPQKWGNKQTKIDSLFTPYTKINLDLHKAFKNLKLKIRDYNIGKKLFLKKLVLKKLTM